MLGSARIEIYRRQHSQWGWRVFWPRDLHRKSQSQLARRRVCVRKPIRARLGTKHLFFRAPGEPVRIPVVVGKWAGNGVEDAPRMSADLGHILLRPDGLEIFLVHWNTADLGV